MRLLLNPLVLRMALGIFVAVVAFVVGAFVIYRVRKDVTEEGESLIQSPLAAEGLPLHAYHAVIQELKQQKHELTAQQQAEKRKAKASETLSAAVLGNLSCGVLFFNASGLVRQANTAARELLGFASPIGMGAADLFRTATLLPANDGSPQNGSVSDALASALSGKAVIRGLSFEYAMPGGEHRVLELMVSPVMADDASMLGATVALTDKTELARLRQDQNKAREIAAEMALGLRNSLTAIAGYAQQLAQSRDSELTRQLADDIAHETAQLDRTVGSFLAGARSAAAGS